MYVIYKYIYVFSYFLYRYINPQFCLHSFLSLFSPQIENIDACLSFLAAKGVNIQGLSAEGKTLHRPIQNPWLDTE